MYYFCTSLDKDGHSPSQEELNAGIQSLRKFPGNRVYNMALWQPHLQDPEILEHIYTWLEAHLNCQFDWDSMRYADKQVWFMLVPERKEFENDKRMLELLHREHIVNQINDSGFIFKDNPLKNQGNRTDTFINNTLPRIYMSVHCLTSFMHQQYGYHAVMLRKVNSCAYEFNVAFGKYFNNMPVLPWCLTYFYSTPHIIKHHTTKREMMSTDDSSITMFKPMSINYDGDNKTLTNAHYWDKERDTYGRSLSLQEKINAYPRFKEQHLLRQSLNLKNKPLEFDLDAELFSEEVFLNYSQHHQAKN